MWQGGCLSFIVSQIIDPLKFSLEPEVPGIFFAGFAFSASLREPFEPQRHEGTKLHKAFLLPLIAGFARNLLKNYEVPGIFFAGFAPLRETYLAGAGEGDNFKKEGSFTPDCVL